MRLIFATNNENKAEEIRAVLGNAFEILTLREAGINIDIPEPHETLEANASEKSGTISRMTGMNCFSEDTGLEVDALHGEPGVHSARYAGPARSFEDNIDKLLQKLKDNQHRSARFRTVISLVIDGQERLFEGICEGSITMERRGNHGFGYDPVFIPRGADRTFGEMNMEEKVQYSHRSKAVAKLVTFLNNLATKT